MVIEFTKEPKVLLITLGDEESKLHCRVEITGKFAPDVGCHMYGVAREYLCTWVQSHFEPKQYILEPQCTTEAPPEAENASG
jgi:hypothetical protein